MCTRTLKCIVSREPVLKPKTKHKCILFWKMFVCRIPHLGGQQQHRPIVSHGRRGGKSHSLRLKKKKKKKTRRALKIPRKKDFFPPQAGHPDKRRGEIEVSAENPANKWCFFSFNSKVVSFAVSLLLFAQYSQVQVCLCCIIFLSPPSFPFFFFLTNRRVPDSK